MIHKCLVAKSVNTLVKWNPIKHMDCKDMSVRRELFSVHCITFKALLTDWKNMTQRFMWVELVVLFSLKYKIIMVWSDKRKTVEAVEVLSCFKLDLNKVQQTQICPVWYKILHVDILKVWRCYVVFCRVRTEGLYVSSHLNCSRQRLKVSFFNVKFQ